MTIGAEPDALAVRVTLSTWSACFCLGLYDALVARAIGLPPARHW